MTKQDRKPRDKRDLINKMTKQIRIAKTPRIEVQMNHKASLDVKYKAREQIKH